MQTETYKDGTTFTSIVRGDLLDAERAKAFGRGAVSVVQTPLPDNPLTTGGSLHYSPPPKRRGRSGVRNVAKGVSLKGR